MDIGELRRRIRVELDRGKRDAADRRGSVNESRTAYERFLNETAAPLFRQAQVVLKAEGEAVTVHTPAESVRLSSDRHPERFIEIAFDATARPPQVIGRTSGADGRGGVSLEERPLGAGMSLGDLAEDDVLAFVLGSLRRLV